MAGEFVDCFIIELKEGENRPRGGGNGKVDHACCPCGCEFVGGVVPVPAAIYGVNPEPDEGQYPVGVYGGRPLAAGLGALLEAEDIGLRLSPGM